MMTLKYSKEYIGYILMCSANCATSLGKKTHLEGTRFICVEKMIVGQNHRYCVIRNNFHQSQFTTCENFHKMLKAMNTFQRI